MQVLTPTGYVDINDLNIGDQVIAYDINDGHLFTNILEAKVRWTYDMFPPVPPIYETDDEGNIIYDEDGNPIILVPGKTSEEVFQETYGDWKFYLINNTWTLFCNQSIWANLNVIHASELQIGDTIYGDQDEDIIITSIEEVEAPDWWRLTISGDHSYIADGLTLHNASRYWVGGGSSSNWNATANTNWGSASGGANNASVPTSTDDVIFDGAGVNGNTNSTISATITILSINITSAYTATMTHNAVLTIAGNVTLGANYTIAGTGDITISATSTITSNGKTFPNGLSLTGSSTKTLVGNFTIGGTLLFNVGASILNRTTTEVINVNGLFAGAFSLSGTATIVFKGGTWQGLPGVSNPIIFDGNTTISGNVVYSGSSIVYTSGTITTTGSTITIQSTTLTLNTSGMTWNVIGVGSSSNTITLASNLNLNGNLTIQSNFGTTINRTTSEVVNLNNGMTSNGSFLGTAQVYLNGGTWSGSGSINTNLYLNGNVTISGSVTYGGSNLTYLSGTITTTASTVVFNGTTTCTITSGAIVYNNFSTGNGTKILVGDLNISGLLTSVNSSTINKTTTEKITVAGGFNNSAALAGTADIYLTGGTWTLNGGVSNNLYISGNITISGTGAYSGPNFTYLSGTVVTTGSTVQFTSATATTITSGTIIFNNVSFSSSGIRTLVGNMTMTGALSTGNTTTINKTTTEQLNIGGGLTISSPLGGTAKINLTGGIWSGTSNIANDLDLNGNITISGTVQYNGTNFIYVSGTITTTGSTVQFSGTTTITSAGNSFNNITFSSTATKTLVGNMIVNGALLVTGITTLNRTTTETISLFGGFSTSGSSTITLSGTAKVIAKGGTFSSSGGNPGAFMQNNLDVDGNVTFSPVTTFWYSTGAFNYISGTTSGIIGFRGGCTVSSLGMIVTSVMLYQAVNIVNDLVMSGPLLNTAINSSINYVSTPANVYANGVDMSGGALDGNVSLYLGGGTWSGNGLINLLNLYLNGNITISGSVRFVGTNFAYVSGNISTGGSSIGFNNNTTITSGPIVYNNVSFSGNTTQQFVGDFNINGTLTNSANLTFNKTTTERMTVNGGVNITGGFISGNADLYITGGNITASSAPFDNIPVYLNGNITLSGTVRKRGGSLIYVSGRINSSNAILTIESPTIMIGFNKCPLKAILVTAGQTLTVDQMPCGTPSQSCTISSTTTSNYTIAFQDGFEKIGRFVALTNATISRPNQLLVTNTPRFNTNRNTNSQNIRYYNQSPNGASKGKPSVVDTMTTPALGLVNDPCFKYS